MSHIEYNEISKKAEDKEQRRLLYENNRNIYKKQRETMLRGISKSFRNLKQDKKEELDYLNELTKLANDYEENGEKE